jgi:hypothetical protein
VWIDAGWETDTIYAFVREGDTDFYRPMVGRGIAQDRKQHYRSPKRTGAVTQHIGDGFHISWVPSKAIHLVEVNADLWKSRLTQMLLLPPDRKGSMTLFHGSRFEHTSFVKHLLSEHEEEEFVPGKGLVKRWERVHSNNHWFDGSYIACAAGSFAGFQLFESSVPSVEEADEGLTLGKLVRETL